MKLTIRRTELLKLLTFASQAVPAKSAEVQYMNYLIDVHDDSLSIITSDGSISTKITQEKTDSKGNEIILASEDGMIQTPAKMLLDIISKLGSDIVTLEMVDTGLLNISDEISNFNLVTRPGEEYPNINLDVPENGKGITLPVKDLETLFDTTSFAVMTKGPNQLYQGINIRVLSNKISFLATDSFRMAALSLALPSDDVNFTFTCPVKALDMVTKISDTGDCSVYFDEQRALFVSGNATISTRLIHGDFPQVERLIPAEFYYSVTLKTEDFLSAADRVRIISSIEDKHSQVRMTLSRENGVTLSAKSTNYGTSQEVLKPIEMTMPEDRDLFTIGFNVDFAIDSVKALRSDKITFAFRSPTVLFMVKNDNPLNIQILSPIQMSDY